MDDVETKQGKVICPEESLQENLFCPYYIPEEYLWHFDMLKDDRRNRAFAEAIDVVLSKCPELKAGCWLDIGTGSGLLASMVKKKGVAEVFACETIPELAKVAKETFRKNNLDVTLIEAHSTAIPVSPSDSLGEEGASLPVTNTPTFALPRKVDVVISELLDTGLLGEGLIESLSDAKARLTSSNFLSIPSRATVYMQLVQSELAYKMANLQESPIPGTSLPPTWLPGLCPGSPSAEVMHVTLSPEEGSTFRPMSMVEPVFSFEFTNLPSGKRSKEVSFMPTETGTVHAVVMWWECEMDPWGLVTLSNEPNDSPPPDHWRQALHLLPVPIQVTKDVIYKIRADHDRDEIWLLPLSSYTEQPVCHCGLHSFLPRNRIAIMNDKARTASYFDGMKALILKHQHLTQEGQKVRVLVVDESLYLPIFAAYFGAKVDVLCSSFQHKELLMILANCLIPGVAVNINVHFIDLTKMLLEGNGSTLEKAKHDVTEDEIEEIRDSELILRNICLEAPDIVAAEPYYQITSQSWDLEGYLLMKKVIEVFLSGLEISLCSMLPSSSAVYAKLGKGATVCKISEQVKYTENIDMSSINQLLENDHGEVQDRSPLECIPIYSLFLNQFRSNIKHYDVDESHRMCTIKFSSKLEYQIMNSHEDLLTFLKDKLFDQQLMDSSQAEEEKSTVTRKQSHFITFWMKYDLDGSDILRIPRSSILRLPTSVFGVSVFNL